MKDCRETALNYLTEDEHMTFTTCERKWINRISRLKEDHPDDVDITDFSETNNGYLVVHLPKSWFTIRVPRKVELSEEEKQRRSERLRSLRENE